ncbi:hypothetical protein [Paenibacillus senegalensis]|uniref:hypothetical protein n=1 Tax=Paenibacillus senegalensis TaxID=1465766 RepID=UPI000288A32B|nr:hypothetical protein [Paenibacillus senegalensis]
MIAICNAGCQQQFQHNGNKVLRLPGGVEKTYFACPHCQHEYVLYYTDAEIRKLQKRIQKTLAKKVNPSLKSSAAITQEKRIQQQVNEQKKVIAEKMAALRLRIEQ